MKSVPEFDPHATDVAPSPAAEPAQGLATRSPGTTTARRWETVQALAGTLMAGDVQGRRPSTTLERAEVGGGTRLLDQLSSDRASGLLVQETLGEGGMGLVRRALQPTLGREVAVKSIRPGRRNDNSLAKILQEAWVLGRLDHPNIVPIHDIEIDTDGVPNIVMKKIEGDAWSDLCHDDRLIRERFGEEPLEWNLRALMQVCNALAYAHARGVLHLDIKPENVMIGAFGEVYLMDWGIAMAMEPDPEGRLPLARECNQIIGTPCYLAPEMLDGDGQRLGPHTDIYLLGATMYELVTGEPPHRGDTMMNMMHDIVHRDPRIERDALPRPIPDELVELVHRCLERDPKARPATVSDVRDAIAGVLAHRDAERLCDGAVARVEAMIESIEAAPQDTRTIYDHFSAARFGFGAALERDSDNARAKVGLLRANEVMVNFELDAGRAAAAAAIAEAAPELPPELRKRVELALADERARAARLAALELDQDTSIGQRTRLFIMAVLGSIWSVLPIVGHFFGATAMLESPSGYVLLSVIFLVLVIAFGVWARESMTKTAFNRRMGAMLVVMFVGQCVLALMGMAMELGAANTQKLSLFLYALSAAFAAVFSDRRILVSAVAYGAAIPVVMAWPDARLLALSAANFVFTLNILWSWRMPIAELRRPRNAPAEDEDHQRSTV